MVKDEAGGSTTHGGLDLKVCLTVGALPTLPEPAGRVLRQHSATRATRRGHAFVDHVPAGAAIVFHGAALGNCEPCVRS